MILLIYSGIQRKLGNNSEVLHPVDLPSTSLSSNRLKTALDTKIVREVRRVVPRVLAETKRREVKENKWVNESRYVRADGTFSTPQTNPQQYETLKSNFYIFIFSQGEIQISR